MIKIMGEPRNYGPTPEETDEMERIETEKRLKKEEEDKEERERQEAEEAALREQREKEWVSCLSRFKTLCPWARYLVL